MQKNGIDRISNRQTKFFALPGSAEEDSMTESDMSSSPNSLMDYHAQTAQILLQYDTATGIFSESGLAKPVPLRRVSDKRLSSEGRTFTNNGGTYDNLSHIGGYPGETTLESESLRTGYQQVADGWLNERK